jgi:hypothetical protein
MEERKVRMKGRERRRGKEERNMNSGRKTGSKEKNMHFCRVRS